MATSGRIPEPPEGENTYRTWSEVLLKATDQADLIDLFESLEEILEMDSEERFTDSAVTLHSVFFDNESIDETASAFDGSPVSRPMYEGFDHVWNLFQSDVLNQLRESRKNEELNLLLGIHLQKAQEAFLEADEQAASGEAMKQPLSTFLALSTRLLDFLFEGEDSMDEMYYDVLLADYYLSQPSALDIENPADLPTEEVKERVKREAAVIAYRELEISVNRGAELAGVSTREFEQILDDHGIRPKHGPDSLDDILGTDSSG